MNKKIFFLLLIVLGFQFDLFAQNLITGKVMDIKGKPLSGVEIMLQGTSIGTTSDSLGEYRLEYSLRTHVRNIVFSGVGKETVVQPISNRSVIDAVVKEDVFALDKVVLTAFNVSKPRKTVGYAACQVSGDEISISQTSNLMTVLQGKVPGVEISTSPGVGSSTNVMIRGAASFSDNQPLYIVDGVPMVNYQQRGNDDSKNYQTDLGSGINALSPDDIESMTVLKGASATALYGSRAANGVVLITTKSGKSLDGKIKIVYDGNINISRVGYYAPMQDKFGQGVDGQFNSLENVNYGAKLNGIKVPFGLMQNGYQVYQNYLQNADLKDFYELGVGYKNALSLEGGNQNTNYYVSMSNTNNDGVYPKNYDTYDRTTFASKLSHSWKNLLVTSNINYSLERTKTIPSGQGNSVTSQLLMVPNHIDFNLLKDYNSTFWDRDTYLSGACLNPYYALDNNGASLNKNTLFGKFQFDYQIIKNLTLTYRFGIDIENSTVELWQNKIEYSDNSILPDKENQSGYYSNKRNTVYELNNDLILSYNFVKKNRFNLRSFLGLNIMEENFSFLKGEVNSLDIEKIYSLNNSLESPISTTFDQKKRLVGVFANVDFDYKNLLYLTLSMRNDWSSTLAKNNNSYFYPGFTASFVFTKLKDVDFGPLKFGKIRASFGFTGKDTSPYYIYQTFAKAQYINPDFPGIQNLNFPVAGVNSWQLNSVLANPDLKAEFTREYELGFDFSFSRFGMDGAYYNKYTKDLISNSNLDYSTGYGSMMKNIGDLSNKGYELLAWGYPIHYRDFRWKLLANFTQNFNKVEKLSEKELQLSGFNSVGIYAVEGKSIGQFKTYKAKTLENGGVVVDALGDVVPTNQMVFVDKDVNEKFRLGFTSKLEYKGFTFETTFDLHYGGYMYSELKSLYGFVGSSANTMDNDRNPMVIPNSYVECKQSDNWDYKELVLSEDGNQVYQYYAKNYAYVSNLLNFYANGGFDYYNDLIIDRSYLKLRNVTLSYSLPKSVVSKIKLQNVIFSLSAGNILLWTPRQNHFLDPETTSFGNSIGAKFGEFVASPSNQVFIFGVNIKF